VRLLELGEQAHGRFRATGGRPTAPEWDIRRLVPFNGMIWRLLERIGEQAGLSAGQLAAMLVDRHARRLSHVGSILDFPRERERKAWRHRGPGKRDRSPGTGGAAGTRALVAIARPAQTDGSPATRPDRTAASESAPASGAAQPPRLDGACVPEVASGPAEHADAATPQKRPHEAGGAAAVSGTLREAADTSAAESSVPCHRPTEQAYTDGRSDPEAPSAMSSASARGPP